MGKTSSKKVTNQVAVPVARKLSKSPVKATKVISHKLASNHNQTLLED
jgi:hypothetical protein